MPTPNLALPFIVQGQAQKEVTHNEALNLLDALVQLAVLDRDLAAPPGAPAEGERWIVAAGATGVWSGHENQVATWQDGACRFSSPRVGWLTYVVDEQGLLAWTGSAWTNALTALQRLLMLGVNTDADASNRLAVKADGAMFSHDDVTPGTGDMRVALNKSAEAKDAGFTFQDAFSARALFGLLGDDDFTVKVSADGAVFHLALSIDKDTGHVGLAGAAADANNALIVKGTAFLFDKETDDVRFTFNKAASGDILQRWWRPVYAFELTLECAICWALAMWDLAFSGGKIAAWAVNASGLLSIYWGARFGVLGVYVNGRSREKEAALTGQPAPTANDSLVKAATRKLRR